ncbi:ATP-dependent DNA helicase RecG [Chryseolinea sp. T2]|uniref:ATP-dependent DNA helicase RecG n=1 Tax=Chryseolinea sp. T2 TaxID=3129255 RepID=UPI00307897B3
MTGFFETSVEFLKGVGPQRAALLNKQLNIVTFADLLQHYPYRYEDRSKFYNIKDIDESYQYVQVKGIIKRKELNGAGFKKRLVAYMNDGTGEIELVWFQGINWVNEKIKSGIEYVAFGKPNRFGSKFSIAHPELDPVMNDAPPKFFLQPVYSLTEKLRTGSFDNKALSRVMRTLVDLSISKVRETLPVGLMNSMHLISKKEALVNIHFPQSNEWLEKAKHRLKFEELFYIQLRLLKMKFVRQTVSPGMVLHNVSLLTTFYNEHLPFPLTDAQKKVIREIYTDLKSGKQMNRLLQGDVGSGKTIVGFICMLIAIGSDTQCALMAPTEILAQQHFINLQRYAQRMNITIALLTGSTKKSERTIIHDTLKTGVLKILIGTHALLEEEVQFNNLGLSVIDEQHRFGVAQRSRLWQKNKSIPPHVLVMTATPIPRTLAMTLYGDLDVSVIDQLPAGRKPIKTVHQFDSHRLQVFEFLRTQIALGRQVYVVYPLIEESEKLDLKHLMDGYESVSRAFPEMPISILHGKMKSDAKDYEMARFKKGETKIMVATTVIEVGVDVPNASVMVIENAERFGLSQLHQLRGRVGRGADQSYCILMTDYKLGADSKTRINTMVRTNNGFEIAEADLTLRGPGDLMGTQQSGVLDLMIADLGQDGELLKTARSKATELIESDPDLLSPENSVIRVQVESMKKSVVNWSKIS